MRLLATGLALAAALVGGALALAVLNLRTLIGAHQDELVARVARAVGRPVEVASVEPSWWPLGVRLRDVRVGEDPAFGPGSFLTAEAVVVTIRARPLFSGRLEAGGVHLDRPRVALVRAADGQWNVESLGITTPDAGGTGAAPRAHRRALRIPLEWVVGVALSRMRDGTIVVDDRRASAPSPIELRHVDLRATDVHLGATARLRLEAALFARDTRDVALDLRVPALGQHDVAQAPFAAELRIADADLATVAGWLGRPADARGRVRRIVVAADGPLARLRARAEVEAADPALAVRGVPLGRVQPIASRARIARDGDVVRVEELVTTLGALDLEAEGRVRLAPWQMTLDVVSTSSGTAALALDDVTLAVGALAGQVSIGADGTALEPLRLEVDGAPFTLRGWVTSAEPPAFDLHVEGRPFDGALTADVALETAGAARARLDATGLDLAAALARVLPELGRRVEGRASGAAVLTARVVERTLAVESLAGSGTISVREGRLRDVNLPDLVVEEIERIPLMPELVSARTRARYDELFASRDTAVESAEVPFTIGRGRFATDRALLVNPAYQIAGQGWIDHVRQLRFRGTVLLGASVSRTLRDDVRAAKYFTADDGRVALPFVARGRLGRSVRVEPDGKRLRERGLTALLGGDRGGRGRGREERRREERPRDGLEDQVLERLERMLRP